jgi:hypothetical protein
MEINAKSSNRRLPLAKWRHALAIKRKERNERLCHFEYRFMQNISVSFKYKVNMLI